MNKRTIYLDNAAATPMDPVVVQAMEPYFSEKFYNPSALYLKAKSVKEDLLSAKSEIAKSLGVLPTEIIATSGGSESNNLAIRGVMDSFPDKKVLVSTIEHDSILLPAQLYSTAKIPVSSKGFVEPDKLRIDDDVVLVSVMLANNEIGTIQPIKELSYVIEKARKDRLARGNKTPIFLHTDACQAPLYLEVNAHRLGVDLMTLNGGKIYGPKASGVLFVSSKLNQIIRPQILGGGHQRGLRSGTEAPAQVIGFATALSLAEKRRKTEVKRLFEIQKTFIKGVENSKYESTINGGIKHRLPNNLHVTFHNVDNERLLFQLEDSGILAASGSACNASSDEPSHVLAAIGLDEEQSRSSIRFSMGRMTKAEDIKYVLQTLNMLLPKKH